MDLNNWNWGAPNFDDMYSYPDGRSASSIQPSTTPSTSTTTTSVSSSTLSGTGGKTTTQQPRNLTAAVSLPSRESVMTALRQTKSITTEQPKTATRVAAPIFIGGGGGGIGESDSAEDQAEVKSKSTNRGSKNMLLIVGGVAALALYFTMR